MVYYYNPKHVKNKYPKGTKLYDGPYMISRKISDVNFEIKKCNGYKTIVVHINKLKHTYLGNFYVFKTPETKSNFALIRKGVKIGELTSEAASNNQCLFWYLRDLTRDSMLIGICCSDSCCFVLVVRKPIRLDGPVKTGQGCAKADRLTDRPSENRPLVLRKPIRLDGPVKTGQGCAKADRLTDRPSENRPLVLRKPIRLDGPVKTGQGCAKADRLTDRPSENRPWVL
ncbi:hypothetical protein HELRODRAFT_182092 [Helobdella robusta]|uniref:Integrase p58-like C-terminal domain-containing protein n=1 Tax=Helobdella robusta TaxID=6412 RepID=T1FHQ4_HELRO|nr:hypothetical protein HELRODRAFT_182092 [Helobdella robusta]ESN91237.1 hypothetical protein HELRODRAFT_182092 [Helobdella robusta]